MYKLAIAYEMGFDFLLEKAGIIERHITEESSKTFASYALYSEDLTPTEEDELIKYLKFLRFSKKKQIDELINKGCTELTLQKTGIP